MAVVVDANSCDWLTLSGERPATARIHQKVTDYAEEKENEVDEVTLKEAMEDMAKSEAAAKAAAEERCAPALLGLNGFLAASDCAVDANLREAPASTGRKSWRWSRLSRPTSSSLPTRWKWTRSWRRRTCAKLVVTSSRCFDR